MRLVIQRVTQARVEVRQQTIGEIQQGLLVFLGIEQGDENSDADWLIGKLMGLRIFSDEEGKMNRNIEEVSGDFLVISQFTLYASTKKGNRPSFVRSAPPNVAIPLYSYFIEQLQNRSDKSVQTGEFGADMQVFLQNDGPVTIIIDSNLKE
jgi:D-tyrosyl-tRNA(Tyr) deacylase